MSLQTRIQTGIYSLGEGGGRFLLNAVILMLLFALVVGVFVTTQFRGLREPAAMEQAHLGRALAEGRGMTSYCLRPSDLSVLVPRGQAENPAVGVPDIRHAPLYPALLGAAFRVLPIDFADTKLRSFAPERQGVLPVGVALVLLCALVLALTAWRLFGAPVAVISLVLLLFSRSVLEAIMAGGSRLTEMLAVTLVFGLALAAGQVRARRGAMWGWALLVVGAGLAAGLAVLAGYALLVVALMGGVLLASGFVRWRGGVVGVYVLLALLVCTPWLVRNHQVSGHWFGTAPYAALDGTYLHAAGELDRVALEPPGGRERLLALRLKTLEHLASRSERPLLGLGEGLVMAFFLVALFVRLDHDGANALKWSLLAAMLGRMLVDAAGTPAPDVLLPFLPWVLVVASALLFQLLARTVGLLAELQRLVVVGWAALALLPTLLTVVGAPPRSAYPPYAPAVVRYVSDLLEPAEVLASDIPWSVAWHGNRPALLLPPTPDALVETQREGMPVGGVYLTTRTGDQPYVSGLLQGGDQAWLPVLNHLVPEAFPWRHGFALPPGRRDQLFLTDRPRWPVEETTLPDVSASDAGSASDG